MDIKLKIEELVKNQIAEMTDYDIDTITEETSVGDFGLSSLDFISIQVGLKRAFGVTIDLGLMAEANILTFKDLIDFLEKSINQ